MDIEVAPGVVLWADELPGPGAPLLLVAGANASGLVWPAELLARLAEHHRVLRYDHRDTGRSTHAVDEQPYELVDLADDAVAVLDAFEVDRAHVVGLGLGGTLVRLLLADHPDRLLSATLVATAAPAGPEDLPGPDPALLRLWGEATDERTRAQELDWRVEHWRLLHGDGPDSPEFDDAWFRDLEERIMEHSGREDAPAAHPVADPDVPDLDLTGSVVPALVVEAPEDPVAPPPHAEHLHASLGKAELVTIDGLGGALTPELADPLADAILAHTAQRDQV